MTTIEELFTAGAPANLLDPLTEVLLRDPVEVEGSVYSRSTLVDLGWRHPITGEPLGPNDMHSAEDRSAQVEKYIGQHISEKINPLLLEPSPGRQENDVETLLELLKAFERRHDLPCVRRASDIIAGRLNNMMPYEAEAVLDLAHNSLQAADVLTAFCRSHGNDDLQYALSSYEARQAVTSGNAVNSMRLADDHGHGFGELEMFGRAPDLGYGGPVSGGGGGAPQIDGFTEVVRHKHVGRRKPGQPAGPYSLGGGGHVAPPRPLMSIPAEPHQPRPYVRDPAETTRHDATTVLRLKGMPRDVEIKRVTAPIRKYQKAIDAVTLSRLTDTTSTVSINFTSYDSACDAMRSLLGLTFDGLRPDMTLETAPSAPTSTYPAPSAGIAPGSINTGGGGNSTGSRPTAYDQAARQPPAWTSGGSARSALGSTARKTAAAVPSHRQTLNIGHWMYSVWMGNLPRPVSRSYQSDLIATLGHQHQKSVLGVHVHATAKGKYLFVDFATEASARQAAAALNGRKLGGRDVQCKFSKKRKVFRAGSAHKEPLNLVTLFVTNIASEHLALNFLADQCPLAHAIDIPMPFKRMAFFQFGCRADAEHTALSVRELQRDGLTAELEAVAIVVNDETQDLIASDCLADIHDMNREWDAIQMQGGGLASYTGAAAAATVRSSLPDLSAQTAQAIFDGWGSAEGLPAAAAATTATYPASQPSYRHPPASTTTGGREVDGVEEVYESDEEDFLELYEGTAPSAANGAAPPYDTYPPADTGTASTFSTVTQSPYSPVRAPPQQHQHHQQQQPQQQWPMTRQQMPLSRQSVGGTNVCVEVRPPPEEQPMAVYSTKFRNYKCYVPLSQMQLGYLTHNFHQNRSRGLGNAFNRLQAKYTVVMQFDKAANQYFFHSTDQDAVTMAAVEMSQWSMLRETRIHMRVHLCLQEYLEQDIVPRLAKQYQVYAQVRLSKHSGCKTCEACAAPVDSAVEERLPTVKWDNHKWHITVAVCGNEDQVAEVEEQFKSYSPLNLSFGLSPARVEKLKDAARVRHGSIAKLLQFLQDKYDVLAFNHDVTFFAVSGLLRMDVIRCTTEIFDMASHG